MRLSDPQAVGFDPQRLARLSAAIADDVARERSDGAVVLVARDGHVVLHDAIGFAERASKRRARTDDVFPIFSVTKTLTTALVLARVDRGELQLTTPVADVIPGFGNRGKHRINVTHLLTHTSGLPTAWPALPPELVGDLDAMVAALCQQGIEGRPGEQVNYSPLSAHALLAEMVRRLDGGRRRFRDILEEEILAPLHMDDTALGVRRNLAARRVPILVRDRSPGLFPAETLEAFNELVTEDAEIPGAGAVSTAADLFRFAECLRRGGELDGARILSPAILKLATTNHTGLRPNQLWNYALELRGWQEFPAFMGLGFFLRGTGTGPTYFGSMASSGTFGHSGAGSTLFWVDPARAITFVCLTAGLLEEIGSIERFQRLSDLVVAALVA